MAVHFLADPTTPRASGYHAEKSTVRAHAFLHAAAERVVCALDAADTPLVAGKVYTRKHVQNMRGLPGSFFALAILLLSNIV